MAIPATGNVMAIAYDQKIEILWQYLRQRNFNRIVYRPHTPVPVQCRDFFWHCFTACAFYVVRASEMMVMLQLPSLLMILLLELRQLLVVCNVHEPILAVSMQCQP